MIMQVGRDIIFFIFLKQNLNGQHSLLDDKMLNDFKVGQTWDKWRPYVLHWNFVKKFRIGSSSLLREIIFAIQPPLWEEDRVLYDATKMTLNIAVFLEVVVLQQQT